MAIKARQGEVRTRKTIREWSMDKKMKRKQYMEMKRKRNMRGNRKRQARQRKARPGKPRQGKGNISLT